MPRIARWRFVLLAVLLFETITWSAQDEPISLERLFEAASVDDGVARGALMDLATNWRSVDAAMLVEMVTVLQIQSPTASVIRRPLLTLCARRSESRPGRRSESRPPGGRFILRGSAATTLQLT